MKLEVRSTKRKKEKENRKKNIEKGLFEVGSMDEEVKK